MNKFLVGMDGSDGARRAAEFAAKRAKVSGAQLVLLHVVDWSPYELLTAEEISSRHVEREKEVADSKAKILQPLADEFAADGIEVEVVVHHGHAAERISELAEELEVDQVFTGRRGRSRVKSLLFGSVSGSLVQMCPVPITVVP